MEATARPNAKAKAKAKAKAVLAGWASGWRSGYRLALDLDPKRARHRRTAIAGACGSARKRVTRRVRHARLDRSPRAPLLSHRTLRGGARMPEAPSSGTLNLLLAHAQIATSNARQTAQRVMRYAQQALRVQLAKVAGVAVGTGKSRLQK